ncbi:MAG: nucleotidyltransferase domain-containing protein [Stellaceae bacterium]
MNEGAGERDGQFAQSPELALLLVLLRWPAMPEAVAGRLTATGPIDWPMFLALVHRHRVVSLVAATLSDAETAGVELGAEGAAAAETLRRRARALAPGSLSQIAEAVGLTRLLAESGIACVQLKGAALSVRAFGQPLLRDGRDIDLLLESRHLAQADAVFASAGYRRLKPRAGFSRWSQALYRRYSHEYVFAAPSGATVELKTRLQPAAGLLPLSVPDVLARATVVEVAGARLATLGDADIMVYLCAHASRHCWFRLKWLADIGALLAGPEPANRLMTDADRLGLAVPALEALRLVHDWLQVEVPEDLLARARGNRRVTRRQSAVLRAMTQLGPDGDPFAIPDFARQLERSEYGLRSNLAYRCALLEWHMMVAAYAAVRALRPASIRTSGGPGAL